MPEHLSPGVYIQEVVKGVKPIEGVSMSTAGFVGIAEKGPLNKAKLVTSMKQFVELFGNFIPDSYLAYSVGGFFENAGHRCFVVRVNPEKACIMRGLVILEAVDGIAILCIPDIMSLWRKKIISLEDVKTLQSAMISHCERMKYRFAVLDSIQGFGVEEIRSWKHNFDSKYAALFYPWLKVRDPIRTGSKASRFVPPSGHIAGIFARSETEKGVNKPPANEVVRGAIGLEMLLNKAQQDILNPEGINCIRFFESTGFRLWGARTVSSDPQWRYINVCRYSAYLEHSIDKGTQWAVFEKNNDALWANVRRTIETFLFNEWRDGNLLGQRQDYAFFVRCDRSTMTQDDLNNGHLVCIIGVAMLKPAEFIIFRIAQFTADRQT